MTGGEKLKEKTEENSFDLNYQMLKQIGKGGDGTVYLVRHRTTGQLRAAKRFRQDAGESRIRELQALRLLQHPSLPQVFDILESAQDCWLIIEYVAGKSLVQFREECKDPEQVLELMEQLALVLVYLHTRRPPVLHLDLKPSNLLITQSGRLVVIDFGASVPQEQGKWSNPCMGTPGFSAPEQQKPDASIDERTDLYGCGAVMYWCLFGYAPNLDTWWKEKEMRSYRLAVFSWRRNVFCILVRCLKRNKEERYADSHDLVREIRRSRRHYRMGRQGRKMAAALVFLILVLWFSVYALLTEQREEEISIGFQYEQQLLISEGLGLEQAAVCYEMAAELCPERFDWCIHLMERICADYLFSLEEERVLKKLIYTVPEGQQTMYAELLPGDPEIFGTFSYEVGIAYWYFYEASGGKRAAAAWFAHAVNSQQYKADWYEAAVVYEKISSYYEKIDRKNERGEQELGYGIYWNDLLNLWKLDYFETEMKVIQKQVAEELLAGILLRCGELQAEQITYEQVQGVLGELQQFGMELGEEENAKTEFLEQCQMAEMAAGRVYGE